MGSFTLATLLAFVAPAHGKVAMGNLIDKQFLGAPRIIWGNRMPGRPATTSVVARASEEQRRVIEEQQRQMAEMQQKKVRKSFEELTSAAEKTLQEAAKTLQLDKVVSTVSPIAFLAAIVAGAIYVIPGAAFQLGLYGDGVYLLPGIALASITVPQVISVQRSSALESSIQQMESALIALDKLEGVDLRAGTELPSGRVATAKEAVKDSLEKLGLQMADSPANADPQTAIKKASAVGKEVEQALKENPLEAASFPEKIIPKIGETAIAVLEAAGAVEVAGKGTSSGEQFASRSTSLISIPAAALVGLVVGSGVVITLMRFRLGTSNMIKGPILATY